ncbi:hypothetical protein [Aeromicrobium chenweiae]|uniref:Uncharacterized protein n=1 Tax=Aeromicrobium chenweiae TaxID=2079793 RepID=A0A2S0WNX1_9ACTN|nr:hypothetical protein [Aeromicrobium chenweiae]AWB93002.1 hypothetical protein C3E78_12740 [Aeromicrobium chenweiae]TGN33992.1 hypothetical protein E4L97_02780 [Aeromicrobium chenweiae]
MRVYLGLTVDELAALEAGQTITPAEAFLSASVDEEDELAALEEAAEHGAVAAAAELDDPDGPVRLVDVASFHLDVDGSGDLAWYAPQEIDAVLREVRGTAS